MKLKLNKKKYNFIFYVISYRFYTKPKPIRLKVTKQKQINKLFKKTDYKKQILSEITSDYNKDHFKFLFNKIKIQFDFQISKHQFNKIQLSNKFYFLKDQKEVLLKIPL